MPEGGTLANRLAIIGTGLIGGSIGLRWRSRGLVGSAVGYSRTIERVREAQAAGAVDEVADTLQAAVAGADLVLLCAPVRACIAMAEAVVDAAAPGCLITDVGSTKAALAAAMAAAMGRRGAEPSPPVFIGGHPMAGSERAGIGAADPYLFENAVWVLCAPDGVPEGPVARLTRLVTETGAHVVRMDPETHDSRVAAISHLPQLAAVALAETAGELAERDPGLLGLAGGGFRDTTRVAQSPAEFWLDVLDTTRDQVRAAVDRFSAELARLRAAVAAGDRDAVAAHFTSGRRARERVPARQKGLLPAYHDLVLYVPDRPGTLGRLCGRLGDAGINVQDIEILRLREGEGGTLRLGFATEELADRALELLRAAGHRVSRRS